MAGRARGRRGPHRGGSVKPSPHPSGSARGWLSHTFAALIFSVLAMTVMVLLAPMVRATWALIARWRT